MNRITKILNIKDRKMVFYITSFLFGLCYLFEVPHGDDTTTLSVAKSRSISDILKKLIEIVRKRGIVSIDAIQFVLFNNLPIVFFVLYMMIIMYLLLNSLSNLFKVNSKYQLYFNVFISAAVMTYSYIDMQSAGWIVTTCCYFVPLVFTVISLIPIKKFIDNEKLTKKEYMIYTLSLIVAISGALQGLAFMVMVYFFLFIYALVTKKTYKSNLVFIIVILIFTIATFTNGSNIDRIAIETVKRMPMLGMYNLITKIDIGLFSSLGWLIFGNNMFIPFTLFILFMFLNKKYHKLSINLLGIIPEIIRIVLKNIFLSNTSINAFEIGPKELGTSNYGLFNLESIGSLSTYILYFAIFAFVVIMIIEFYLLSDNYKIFLEIMLIISIGFVSRFVLTFTPNVFASAQRTFIYFNFSIIISIIIIYANNIYLLSEKENKILTIIFLLVVIFTSFYFFAYVYNYLGSSLFDIFE